MAIKLIKTYSPNENATRLKQQEQDAQTVEDALNKQSSDLATHKTDPKAHAASQITYEGTNVETALKAVNAYVDNLVIEASKGDSNAEVVAARTNYDGTTDASLKARLDRYAQKTDNGQLFKLTKDSGLAIPIDSGSLNDITTPGIYYVKPGSDPTNPSVLNMPENRDGFLEVSKADYLSGTLQKFIPYRYTATQTTSTIYTRNYGVGITAWTSWAATADKLSTETALASINTGKINVSQTVLSDSSLNGSNTYPLGVTVQSVDNSTNFPKKYGMLTTFKQSNYKLMQFFSTNGTSTDQTGGWVRNWHETSGWSNWFSLYGNNSWCNVSVTNEQPLTQGYTQKVKFDRIINDSHTQFNTSTNRFTAKVSGMYMVGVGLYVKRIKEYNNVELMIYRNGSRYKNIHQNRQDPGNHTTGEWNMGHYGNGVTVPLNVGDYIEIFIFVGAGQDLTISDNSGWYNYFDIYRIGDIPMNITI